MASLEFGLIVGGMPEIEIDQGTFRFGYGILLQFIDF